MRLTKQKKQEIIKGLEEKFQKAKLIAFLNFHGLKVKDTSDLRRQFTKQDLEYKVAKKTFARIALKNLGFDAKNLNLEGETAFAVGYDDPAILPKIVFNFAKTHPEIKVLGGVFENKFIDASVLKSIANLPSKETLIGQLVGALNSPLQGLVGTLNAPISNFVYFIDNLNKAKK